jgi:hypothetical protein
MAGRGSITAGFFAGPAMKTKPLSKIAVQGMCPGCLDYRELLYPKNNPGNLWCEKCWTLEAQTRRELSDMFELTCGRWSADWFEDCPDESNFLLTTAKFMCSNTCCLSVFALQQELLNFDYPDQQLGGEWGSLGLLPQIPLVRDYTVFRSLDDSEIVVCRCVTTYKGLGVFLGQLRNRSANLTLAPTNACFGVWMDSPLRVNLRFFVTPGRSYDEDEHKRIPPQVTDWHLG